MSVESAADRAQFLADFGTTAVYTHGTTTVEDLAGVYENPTEMATSSDHDAMERRPSYLCREADLPEGYGPEDPIVIEVPEVGARPFVVKRCVPDGTGFVVLGLERGY